MSCINNASEMTKMPRAALQRYADERWIPRFCKQRPKRHFCRLLLVKRRWWINHGQSWGLHCGEWVLSEIKVKQHPLVSCATYFLCLSSFINHPIQLHPEQSLKIRSSFTTAPLRPAEKCSRRGGVRELGRARWWKLWDWFSHHDSK